MSRPGGPIHRPGPSVPGDLRAPPRRGMPHPPARTGTMQAGDQREGGCRTDDDVHSPEDRRGTRGAAGPGPGRRRPARRRGDRALHREVPQGGHRHTRRRPAAGPGGTPPLPARTGGPAGGDPGVDPVAGQARRRARGADQRRRVEGQAGGHLPALQAETAHQGADRQGGRARTARRPAPRRPHPRPEGRRGRLRRRREGRRRRDGRPGGRPGHPGGTLRRGRRPHRRAPRGDVDPGPGGRPGAGGPGERGREVRRLLRLLRALHQTPLPPDPRAVPGGEGRRARPRPRTRRGQQPG